MGKRTENHESNLLSDILSEITPQEQAKTDKRMLLALKIADAMKSKGLKKIDLARLMEKQPSVITKWLSGTHNFESDTLFDLEYHLEAKFIDTEEKLREQILYFHLNVSQMVNTEECFDRINDAKPIKSYPTWIGTNYALC